MNLYTYYRQHVLDALKALRMEGLVQLADDVPLHAIQAEPPRDPEHGCIATNVAMVLAKAAGQKPRDLAQLVADKMLLVDGVREVEIAGPGFINMRLHDHVWQQHLLDMIAAGEGYGQSDVGKGTHINIEYVSANPTGPMHIGHARGAVVGDALAGLLQKAGYAVTKEYYTNDAGGQVEVLARSVHLRYREALGEAIGEIPPGYYPGDYLVPAGQALAKEFGDQYKNADDKEWLPVFQERAIAAMMEMIRGDLKALGVEHDVFSSEKAIVAGGKVEEALKFLEDKGLIYTGVLEPPKGKLPDDWEARPQTLFKSSEFGDDVDRALKKSDGSYTYFTPDIAYHYDKYTRGANVLIDVLGADHGGYVKRIKAAVAAMSDGKAGCEVLLCQLVKLMKNGEEFKMSKRAGTFVTLRDVVELVGKDVLRFIMLTRKNDASLSFDVEEVQQQSKDNPVFYVQYAHARCCSVQRHAQAEFSDALKLAQKPTAELLAVLSHPAELALIRQLATFPRMVESAALAYEPHRIAFFLQEIAASFHGLWNLGNSEAELRFLQADNPDATAAHLVLVQAVQAVIAAGLGVIGVTPMQEMQ